MNSSHMKLLNACSFSCISCELLFANGANVVKIGCRWRCSHVRTNSCNCMHISYRGFSCKISTEPILMMTRDVRNLSTARTSFVAASIDKPDTQRPFRFMPSTGRKWIDGSEKSYYANVEKIEIAKILKTSQKKCKNSENIAKTLTSVLL